MNLNFWYILLISTLLISSCTTRYVHTTIEPAHESFVWVSGKKVVEKSSELARVTLSHIKNEGDCYVFSVEVVNLSDNDLLVAPELIRYNLLDGLTEVPDQSNDERPGIVIHAVNPEHILAYIQREINRAQEDYSTTQTENAVFGLIDLVLLFGDSGPDAEKRRREMNEDQRDREQDLDRYQRLVSEKKSYKEVMEACLLRKTTLRPSASIQGVVYLPMQKPENPKESTSSPVIIIIPIEYTDITFNYVVTRTVTER